MIRPIAIAAALAAVGALAGGCLAGDGSVNTRKKLVLADYFPHHRTRQHDGRLGSWQQSRTAEMSKARKTYFNYNPDLVGADGKHQLAATVYPLVGMQSDLDPDYQEFQILQAKVAHIDGFVVEWVLPGRQTSPGHPIPWGQP